MPLMEVHAAKQKHFVNRVVGVQRLLLHGSTRARDLHACMDLLEGTVTVVCNTTALSHAFLTHCHHAMRRDT